MMFLVDSHCHPEGLDYEKIHQNPEDMLEKARMRNVKFMIAVGTTLPGYHKTVELFGDKENVAYACGVHPLNLDSPWTPDQLYALAAHARVVALGETGLDYHYQPETKFAQQNAFLEHMRIAAELKKPVIIHMRDATADTIALLKEGKIENSGGVLHCFTEDKDTAIKLLDLGLYISFSGIVTFKNAEMIREAARIVPLDRMLIETDSPYLAPIPYRGKENQPAYTREVAEYLAILKGIELKEFAQITTKNVSDLFHIPLSRLQSP